MKVRKRNDFAPLLVSLGLNGTGVEVGVAEGDFSFYLLDRWPGICYQVDPWRAFSSDVYLDFCNKDTTEQERRYQLVKERAKKYHGRARLIRLLSAEAALGFRDNELDFVYIDANHKLDFVRQDICVWWPKMKRGGVFAGHDYLDGVISSGDYGVKTAVTEFAEENNLSVNVTEEKDYPSWWVVKP